ncbi:chromate resistance protein ChrB [Rhizobium sp. Root149]|uniref:Chromate resistance protein ChrB n=1 Tax=Rhizobium sp. Root149 TaxID=1736473 RepID=UPI0007125A3D|nr:Chromate resistance protein ChrB [Rhizobium sp. Root149]KQZ62094.1 chromate resistance protein ChrB [Rhizobium sp. Root149]
MDKQSWLLLTYKVPTKPNRRRVALWRKLKGLGAVYLQSGVCLLPRTDEHRRTLKIIENEIEEMEGESILLETAPLDQSQSAKVEERFRADRDAEYLELIERCDGFEAELEKETVAGHFSYAEIEENDLDLKKLKTWLEKIKKLDFYGANLASQAEARLANCEALLDAYANEVFLRHEENR